MTNSRTRHDNGGEAYVSSHNVSTGSRGITKMVALDTKTNELTCALGVSVEGHSHLILLTPSPMHATRSWCDSPGRCRASSEWSSPLLHRSSQALS